MPVITRLLVTSCYMALVIVVSVTPGNDDSTTLRWVVFITPSLLQKLLHVGVYAGLSVLWMWALEHRRARIALVVVISVAFSVSLEVAQTFVPGRFGNLFDVALNGLGTGLGLLLYPRLRGGVRVVDSDPHSDPP